MALPEPPHDVLRRAQRGDERAFEVIVRAYESAVFTYVLRVMGNRALAEEVTQEVFLRVFQGLPRFSHRSRFTTWLFEVTKNRVLDEIRALERRPRGTTSIDDLQLVVTDAPVERLELVEAVWGAVGALPLDLKLALLLRDIVGLSYAEIAEALGITVATVKWRIHQSRRDVIEYLHDLGLLEEPSRAPVAVR